VNLRDAISTGVFRHVIVSDSPVPSLRLAPREGPLVTHDPLQRRVAASGAILLAIGMVTGLWSGAALSGAVVVAIPRLALAAHLNCLMGCFWLLGFAFTLPMLSYGEKGKERLAKLMLVPTYGNWLITLLASFLGVRGISFLGELRNDVVAVLLFAFVVVPSLGVSFAWAWGFKKAR
jgi:hydroxylaminobenzene mutase